MQVAECHQEAGLDLRCTHLKLLRRIALRNGPIASAKRSQVHQDNCHGAAASACQVVLETVPQAPAKRRKKAKAPRYFQWEEELELAFERTSETAPADVRILGNDPVALARVGIGLFGPHLWNPPPHEPSSTSGILSGPRGHPPN